MKKHIYDKIQYARQFGSGTRTREFNGEKHYTKAELSAMFQGGEPLSESQHKRLFGKELPDTPPVKAISKKKFLDRRADAFLGIKDGQYNA